MKVLAFIPARGGSKGIPRKNLVPLNGKPLIQYTLEAAQESKSVAEIFISSDDAEIIDFCISCGIDVPYRRPAELAGDASTMIDAVLHALSWLEAKGSSLPEAILLLQPTSPLRTSRHIDEAVEMFSKGISESLVSVHEMIEHPYECVRKETNAWSYLAKAEIAATRRQDYKERFYYINGAIYLAKTEMLRREKTFLVEGKTALYMMEPLYGIDIDEEYDLRRAEFFLCPAE